MGTNPSDEIDLVSTAERTVVDLEERGLAPLLALGHYKYLHAHGPMPDKRHDTLLVVAQPIKGRFTFAIDGTSVDARPGEAVRIPPGVAFRTGTILEPRGELMWLILRHTDDSAKAAPDELRRAIGLLAYQGGRLCWPTATEPNKSADQLFTLAHQPRDWIADGLLRQALIETVLRLTQALQKASADGSGHPHPGIARVLAYIDNHLTEPCGVTELEALSGLQSTRFYEAFRAETGTSPKDYLLRRRIEHARRWLCSSPETTITEIAHALGFSSSQYFSAVFRRYQGCSPSQARRRR